MLALIVYGMCSTTKNVLAVLWVPDEQRAEHEKRRAVEKAVRLAAQAQAAGADLNELQLPAGLEQATKQKTKKK